MAGEKDTTPGKAETPQEQAGKIFEAAVREMEALGFGVRASEISLRAMAALGFETARGRIELYPIRQAETNREE